MKNEHCGSEKQNYKNEPFTIKKRGEEWCIEGVGTFSIPLGPTTADKHQISKTINGLFYSGCKRTSRNIYFWSSFLFLGKVCTIYQPKNDSLLSIHRAKLEAPFLKVTPLYFRQLKKFFSLIIKLEKLNFGIPSDKYK